MIAHSMVKSQAPRRAITVLIADDEPAVAESLRHVLSQDPRFRVVAVASSSEETIDLATREQPDVVLVDLDGERVDGVETTRRLRAMHPELRLVAMGASLEPERVGPAIDAGASGYLPKPHARAVLAMTIERVAAGAMVLSHEGITSGRASFAPRPASSAPVRGALVTPLTPRELQVLQLIAQGRSTAAIAHELGIRPLTARSHVKKILLKLGAHSRVEAVTIALRHNLIRITE
jgi:DNA-binding NarL/FixJ family response regulator